MEAAAAPTVMEFLYQPDFALKLYSDYETMMGEEDVEVSARYLHKAAPASWQGWPTLSARYNTNTLVLRACVDRFADRQRQACGLAKRNKGKRHVAVVTKYVVNGADGEAGPEGTKAAEHPAAGQGPAEDAEAQNASQVAKAWANARKINFKRMQADSSTLMFEVELDDGSKVELSNDELRKSRPDLLIEFYEARVRLSQRA
mmetsp:Transcript_9776/g.35813  ORF Transcript_9776/g.35813 Transcript_9776/m.35813 type:complete len:202 (-) Transcript_9776:247-852(-)